MPFRALTFLAFLVIIKSESNERFLDFKERAASKNERISVLVSSKTSVEDKLKELATTVQTDLLSHPSNFYNYTIVCGADIDPLSRVKEFGHDT